MLLSCTYCCFNPLQHDAIGAAYGYCVLREAILKQPTSTTCGAHRRRDLGAEAADQAAQAHKRAFPGEGVYQLPERANGAMGERLLDRNLDLIDHSAVGSTVRDWLLGSRADTLAQLSFQVRQLGSVKAEIALLSLGRGYVANCRRHGGNWTSGVSLVWWMRRWLDRMPDVKVDDLWAVRATSLSRQIELAMWSVLMQRVNLIADIASAAESELVDLADAPDAAALASGNLSPYKLQRWIHHELAPRLSRALPDARYRELAAALHSQPGESVSSL